MKNSLNVDIEFSSSYYFGRKDDAHSVTGLQLLINTMVIILDIINALSWFYSGTLLPEKEMCNLTVQRVSNNAQYGSVRLWIQDPACTLPLWSYQRTCQSIVNNIYAEIVSLLVTFFVDLIVWGFFLCFSPEALHKWIVHRKCAAQCAILMQICTNRSQQK